MRLLTYLQSLWVSRRMFTEMVDQWEVFVNGQKVESYKTELEDWDQIVYRKQMVVCMQSSQISEKWLILFHKPVGYVCSKSDPHNATIYELLPESFKTYYYIGRLDKDSRWLVLMTNDSKLVDQYEHPRHGITKEYLVTLNKSFREEDKKRCIEWIEDEWDLLKCVSLDTAWWKVIRIVLNEWKKRHIRRMMSSLRYHVEDLMRVREWEFELGNLKEGEWREVKEKEW